MAEIKPIVATSNDKYQTFTWAGVTQADTFGAAAVGRLRDITVQMFGTIGGTTVTLQGSMDGTNFAGLSDGAEAISLTAAGLARVAERPRFMKPSRSGGTGVNITVVIGGSVVY